MKTKKFSNSLTVLRVLFILLTLVLGLVLYANIKIASEEWVSLTSKGFKPFHTPTFIIVVSFFVGYFAVNALVLSVSGMIKPNLNTWKEEGVIFWVLAGMGAGLSIGIFTIFLGYGLMGIMYCFGAGFAFTLILGVHEEFFPKKKEEVANQKINKFQIK